MTYSEFAKIAPRETVDFVDKTLPYLKYYLENNYSIEICSYWDSFDADIILLTMLSILSNNKRYANFLMQKGFEKNFIHIQKNIGFNIDKEKEFKWISRALPEFESELTYYLISPIDFVYTISKYFSNTYTSEFEKLFQHTTNLEAFSKYLKEYSQSIREENLNNLKKELTKDLPVSVVNYFEMASRIENMLTKNLSINERLALSLIASVFEYSDISSDLSEQEIIIQLWGEAGIDSQKIWWSRERVYLRENITKFPVNYLTIKAYFEPIIIKLKEKDTPISISAIIEEFLDRDLPYSINIEQILTRIGANPSILLNFNAQVKKELENQKSKNLIIAYDETIKNFIDDVLKIHERINKIMSVGPYNQEILNSLDDILELSMCLALSKNSPEYFTFFEEKGLTVNRILNILNLPPVIMNIDDDKPNYNLFRKYYQSYFADDFNDAKKNLKIKNIAPRIFDDLLNKSQLLEKICKLTRTDYAILKMEVQNGKSYVAMLPVKEKISRLNAEPIDLLEINNMASILKFGNSLVSHSNYIHDEMPRLFLSATHNNTISTLNESLNQVYTFEKTQKSFWDKLFASKKNEEVPSALNLEAFNNLKKEIDDNLKVLYKEVIAYEELKNYLEAYRPKNSIYYETIIKTLAEIELKPVKEDFLDQLNLNSLKEILNNKKTRFLTTEVLMKQELIHLNKTIVEHFITITALEMARDDLLPLIGIELSINKGRHSEKNSLELSQNIFKLFSSLLNQNVAAATANMKILNNSALPKTNLALINQDLIDYYKQLKTIESIDNEIQEMNNNSFAEANATINLESPNDLNRILIKKE